MTTTDFPPASCQSCGDLIDGHCHGSTPEIGNLNGDGVWPRIRRPSETVCRRWDPTPIGDRPPAGLPPPPVVVVVRCSTAAPAGPHERSLRLLVALLVIALALALFVAARIG